MQQYDHTFINLSHAIVQPVVLSGFSSRQVSVEVLRLDQIHPVISGNKWFKLKNYLKAARDNHYSTILTYGGAWSNHIIAAAFASQQSGLKSVGLIRGEEPALRSHTLLEAERYGMEIHFIGRSAFREKEGPEEEIAKKFGNVFVIPEGGAGKPGVEGCSEILSLVQAEKYSHMMCCLGTGTMFAGLLNASPPSQQVTGVSVLKGIKGLPLSLLPYITNQVALADSKVIEAYHFGGYAKKNKSLLEFMNHWYQSTKIPSDFVYTAKLFYACSDLVNNNYFPRGSSILLIHSGGLQGNASLPPGTLKY